MKTTQTDCVDLEVYRHTRRDVFGSRRSLGRFIEQHRAELVHAGALAANGANVCPRIFDGVVEAVGRHPSSKRRQREAAASARGELVWDSSCGESTSPIAHDDRRGLLLPPAGHLRPWATAGIKGMRLLVEASPVRGTDPRCTTPTS